MRFIVALLCAILLWPAGLVAAADKGFADVPPAPVIPATWLVKKISVEEAEAEHPGVRDERAIQSPELAKPFGFRHAQWEALKADMRANDEIWTFSSPSRSWEDLAGRAGVALVRDGQAIKAVVTMLN